MWASNSPISSKSPDTLVDVATQLTQMLGNIPTYPGDEELHYIDEQAVILDAG